MTAAIANPDPLVRSAAPRALTPSASQPTLPATAALLRDPIRAVSVEAVRALAGTELLPLTPELPTAFVNATEELVAAEPVDADRPEPHLNLGVLDTGAGNRPKPRRNTARRCASILLLCRPW